jgi:hypothetical protein
VSRNPINSAMYTLIAYSVHIVIHSSAIYTPDSLPCSNCVPVFNYSNTTAAYLVHFVSLFAAIYLHIHTRDSLSSSHFVPVFRRIRIWRPLLLTVYANFQLYTYVTACLLHNMTQPYLKWHKSERAMASAIKSLVCHRRGPGCLMCDLWSAKTHWDWFILEYFG